MARGKSRNLVWRNNDCDDLITNLKLRASLINSEAEQLMRDVVFQAEKDQRQILLDAHTNTGRDREEAGSGLPGRVVSGEMMDQVMARVEAEGGSVTFDDNGKIVGVWGWERPENYYLFQDFGTQTIEAAHSLLLSFLSARERLAAGITSIAKTGQR